MSLLPCAKPPVWHSQVGPALAAQDLAEVFVADVYRGLPKAPKGSIARIRRRAGVPEVEPRHEHSIDMNATFYGCYEEPAISCQKKGEPIPVPERQ